jgi:cell wall-associated NlpC family hydrolase
VPGRDDDSARPRRRFPLITSASCVLGLVAMAAPFTDLATAETPEPDTVQHPTATTAVSDDDRQHRSLQISGVRVVRTAADERGHPYRYGGDGPVAFDCSGLTTHVYQQFGVRLPHNAAAQYRVVDHVPKSQVRLGDLVFIYDDDGIYHVGIYAGGDRMWAAGNPGEVVRQHRIWTDRYVVGRP